MRKRARITPKKIGRKDVSMRSVMAAGRTSAKPVPTALDRSCMSTTNIVPKKGPVLVPNPPMTSIPKKMIDSVKV